MFLQQENLKFYLLRFQIAVKTSALVKIRQIFTMELFTEQVWKKNQMKTPYYQYPCHK